MEKRVILVDCNKDVINSLAHCIKNDLRRNGITKVDVFRSAETYIETKYYLIVIDAFYIDPYKIRDRTCYGVCNFNSNMCSYLRRHAHKFLNVNEMIKHVIEIEKAIKMASMSIYGVSSFRQMEKEMDVASVYPFTICNSGIRLTKSDVNAVMNLYTESTKRTEKNVSLSLNTNNNTIHIEHMIKRVIFNEPATIVIWNDGTKTVVKAEGEEFDPEKGLAMAISKKVMGNNRDYYNTFKKWTKKYYKKSDK